MSRFALTASTALLWSLPPADASGLLAPAQNFSAYYYRNPGGIGRPSARLAAYGPRQVAVTREVPYAKSCGGARTWDGTRCVAAASRK
jgi:hypothetical protein